ncbi:DUF3418 domain-containing protein, partial [Erwinia amylovora]|uniref:DUF3418 domain-containing protein n=1 Tax=Erwinia amylovora TaxID=552 RepID=UPI0020BFC5D4
TFRLVDESIRTRAEGTDLTALQAQLISKVPERRSNVADAGVEQRGLHGWGCGDLPEYLEQKGGHYRVKAGPALVVEKDGGAIRLFA